MGLLTGSEGQRKRGRIEWDRRGEEETSPRPPPSLHVFYNRAEKLAMASQPD